MSSDDATLLFEVNFEPGIVVVLEHPESVNPLPDEICAATYNLEPVQVMQVCAPSPNTCRIDSQHII
jgi:hypothetical protein